MHEKLIARLNFFALAFFLSMLLLMVFNTFCRHITPDLSVFLLHTRTFLEKGNRFIDSFDNKGPIMTFFLAPAVWLFGAKIEAAALMQLILYFLAIIFLSLSLKELFGLLPSLLIGVFFTTFCYSAWLWGGNLRPEDFMPLICSLMFFLNTKKPFSKIAYFVNGVSIAITFFLKLSLIVAPIMVAFSIGLAELFTKKNFGVIVKAFVFTLFGLLSVAVPIIIYLVLFDDINGWIRQTLLLPLQSRIHSTTSFKLVNFLELISKTGFSYLLFGAVLSLLLIVFFKSIQTPILSNVIIFLTTWLSGELIRVFAEGSPWPYLLIGSVPASLVSISLSSHFVSPPFKKLAIWIFPLLFLSPLLSDAYALEIRAFKLRTLEKGKSPYEELALQMKTKYQEQETLFVEDTDYQLFLLLKAPAPYPVLKRLFWFITDEERKRFLSFYAKNPPDWIIVKREAESIVDFSIEGGVDFPYHIWHYKGIRTNRLEKPFFVEGTELSAKAITRFIPSDTKYTLSYDIGWAQAWHKQK